MNAERTDEPSSQLDHYIDMNCIRIDDTASVGDAMEIASDFVGEIIPIWNRRQNVVVGVISENAIFSAYLDEQRKITEMEKQ